MNAADGPRSDLPRSNELLDVLPSDERGRIAPHLKEMLLKAGEVLYEPGTRQKWVYFPCGATVSLLHVMENGDSTEVAMVGNEGMLGISAVLSGVATPCRAMVQGCGAVLRVSAGEICKEFARGGALQHVLLCYAQALMAQAKQTAACNRYHTVNRQLCRWLLMCLDRGSSTEMIMTQETIANLLGVRRAGVAVAAKELQDAGAIEYKHGRIRAIDRARLESLACECYRMIRSDFAQLLPWSSRASFVVAAATATREPAAVVSNDTGVKSSSGPGIGQDQAP